MELDQLKDFNEVVEYYREILVWLSSCNPKSSNGAEASFIEQFLNNFRILKFSNITAWRIIFNNISLFVSKIHETIDEEDEELLLDTSFSDVDFLNEIDCKEGELSLREKRKQLRNCLAHADSYFIIEKLRGEDLSDSNGTTILARGDVYIQVENDKIKGKIKTKDFYEIALTYMREYKRKKYDTNILVPFFSGEGIRSVKDCMNAFHSIMITRTKDNQGMTFEKFKYWFFRRYRFSEEDRRNIEKNLESLKEDFTSFKFEEIEKTPEDIDFLRKYISYIGLRKLSDPNVCNAFYEVMFEYGEQMPMMNMLLGMTETLKSLYELYAVSFFSIYDEEYEMKKTDKIYSELSKYIFQAPMLYADNLIGMTYYMLNYTREINEQNERRFFNYYNFGNLEEISAKLVDDNGNEEVPIQINPIPKLQKELKNVKTDLSNLRRRMQFKRRKLRKMENPEDRTPNKEETITFLKEELSNDEKNVEEYVLRRDRLECDIEECSKNDYKDSSDFFRHIRNSIAHGNYIITYGDLNNLEEITYCFKDIDERTLKTYTVELTARQLLMILDAVQLKVNECDRGYLDGKDIERKIMEVALRQCSVGMDEVNYEQLTEEEPMQEKGDEEIDEP